MQNPNFNIELGSQPPDSQLITRQGPQNSNYLFQEDEEPGPELQNPQIQPPNLQSPSLEDRLKAFVQKMFSMDQDKATRFAVFSMLFFYILSLPFLYVSIYQEKPYIEDIRGSLESMAANLKADPILDLQIIDRKSTCPDGFEPLKLATWHGTRAGCHCENGDLFDYSCRSDQAEKCKTVSATLPIEIYEEDGKIWCGKRAVLGKDYVKKTECPSGYKECYPGSCFVGLCPVTKVAITSTGEVKVILTKKQGELPLINLQITPHTIPCFNKNMFPEPTNQDSSSYQLSIHKEKGCDKYGFDDKFSAILSSQSISDSYTQKAFRYSTMNLPHFEKYSKNTPSVLSWRTRITTRKNDHCLNIDEKSIQNSINLFNQSFAFASNEKIGNIVIQYVFLFIFLVLPRCFMTSASYYKHFPGMMKSAAIGLIFYGPAALQFFSRFEEYQELKIMKKYFIEYKSLGCFGEGQGSLVIDDFLATLEIGEMKFLMFFGLILSDGLAVLVSGWFLLLKEIQSRRNSNP